MRIARDLRTARNLAVDCLRIIGILPRYEVVLATSDDCWTCGFFWFFDNACMAARGAAKDPHNEDVVGAFVACRTHIERVNFKTGAVHCGGWIHWIQRDGVMC